MTGCLSGCGRCDWRTTTRPTRLSGSGKPWTARCRRRRWGGGKSGPSPTDRGKRGSKRSLLTDGRGVPLGLAMDGANRPDYQLADATIQSIPIPRPEPTPEVPQHLLLDNGYDYDAVHAVAFEQGYTLHIRPRGEEARQRQDGKRARRSVVERSHSWFNRFRRLLIRWEHYPENHLALLHLAAALITLNTTTRPAG